MAQNVSTSTKLCPQCQVKPVPKDRKYCGQDCYIAAKKSQALVRTQSSDVTATNVTSPTDVSASNATNVTSIYIEPPQSTSPIKHRRPFYRHYQEWVPWVVGLAVAYANGWALARQPILTSDPNVWFYYIMGVALELGIVAFTQYIVEAVRQQQRSRRTVIVWLASIALSSVAQGYFYSLSTHAPLDLVIVRIGFGVVILVGVAFCMPLLPEEVN